MKALTLWQPWATLVVIGVKRIETRSWKTNYRGPLAIHAAARPIRPAEWSPSLEEALQDWHARTGIDRLIFPLGSVVSTCNLIDCVPTENVDGGNYVGESIIDGPGFLTVTPQEFAFGDYTPGRYAWLCDNIVALTEPSPAKGAQGLWDWNPQATGPEAIGVGAPQQEPTS